MSEILQPLQLPLWGSRLIEASAGTGKTWTLASLYLRLVLGHGGENAFPRPLAPSEILVMTFTRAATRELSDRIRSRLLEAAGCFRGQAEPELDDKLLADLLGEYPEGAERLAAAWRLASAAECMDDAAVHTIDAWCQRMLREHAFDSGCLFDEELTANEDAMLDEAVRDFWRQEVYPLSGDVLTQVLGVWPSTADLRKDAGELLKHELPTNAGQSSLVAALEGAVSDRAATLIALKVGWDQRASEMEAWLDALIATKPSPVKPRQLAKANYAKWLAALSAWARDPMLERPDMKTGAEKFAPKGMRGVLLEGSSVTVPAVFEAFGQLMRSLDQLATVNTGLRLHAASAISERLALLKARAGSFGFADMLTRLDDALDIDRNGDGAVRLRRRILAQYPVALVDEFQDTSPVQSRIFDRLYRIEDNDPATALLLIGDPKQSIYAFRGADIQSYLAARLATEGRHYVLGTNHRSTEGLVDAVNHLFDHAEARGGEGAFMFRADGASAASSPLPFLRVTAKGRSEALRTSAGPCPALLMELDAALLDTSSSRRQFAARCAEHIATLLNDDQAGFDHPTKGIIRLRPADIAVLVRTGKEAAAVRRELRRRKVASVYLSDKDSVFESQEARELIHWLRAVAAPRDTRLARAAMATPMAGLPIGELIKLAADDEVFDERCEQLRQLQIAWQSQGVLSMLRQTLHVLGIPARWLGASNTAAGAVDVEGERRLTNFMHLAELLQSASAEVEGEQALVRWLEGQIEGDASSGEEKIVRLESDADLVKVVTVHKSKGLEYPLVFLPFPCHFRGVDGKTKQVMLVDDAGRRRLHMQPTAEQVAAADKDRLREDLRLLYVALTRARHMLWVGLSALRIGNASACVFPRSAIGYLLGGSGAADPSALPEQIAGIVKPCAGIAIATTPPFEDLTSTQVRSRGAPGELRQLSAYAGDFERSWAIGSYSNMVRALALPPLKASSDAVVRDDEVIQDVSDVHSASSPRSPVSAVPGAHPWHRFPRGALPGNFLHDQLEWLAGENFALTYETDLQQRLLKRCERDGWGHRADDVLTWLTQVVSVALPPMSGPLCDLRSTLPEMEFWFPSENLVASAVDGLCRQQLLHGRDRPVLPDRELHGMLMGFADLVFEQDGRYWVLDYKSNHLGNSDGDYADEALESAMAAHRYDVQAALYLLALHRLLRTRLGSGYDPARHLGGAIYFFLRGVSSPGRGCYHVRPTPALLDGLDVLLGAQPAARKELA